MAPRPSSSGISRSRVTTSGAYWWTFRIASTPSRAVATTLNSPPSTSTNTRRIRALSSATTTVGMALRSDDVGIRSHGSDLDASVLHMKTHRSAALAAHRLAENGNLRRAQRVSRRQHIAFPHLNRSRRNQLAEHAGATRELGDQPAWIGAQLFQAGDEHRYSGVGKLCRITRIAGQTRGWQQHVGHRAGAGLRIVQHDRDARPESERHQYAVATLGRPRRNLDDDFLQSSPPGPLSVPERGDVGLT